MVSTSKYEAWLAESGHADHIHGMCHIEAWEAGQAELRAEVEQWKKGREQDIAELTESGRMLEESQAEIERLKDAVERLRDAASKGSYDG